MQGPSPNGLVEAEVEPGSVAVAAEHEREADEEEADEAEAEDGEVGADHVGGVLGPAEAGLDQGEAGLHEDHQRGADDDPEQVAGLDGVVGGGCRRCPGRRPGPLPGRTQCRPWPAASHR